ncbi:MAG: SDR family oxidoreductase, partial [Dehalococcoidia bacterium]|nr:SDR family oxidoreductase [Dehalococcoidia bacterium]
TFFCCVEAGKVMIEQKKGKIINIASAGGLVALPRLSAYSSSKGGVIQVTRALAVDWAPYNIQVNAIAPGWVATEFTQGLRDNESIYNELAGRTPAKRFGQPDEMVGAALYFASEASNYTTGAVLAIDGGLTAW